MPGGSAKPNQTSKPVRIMHVLGQPRWRRLDRDVGIRRRLHHVVGHMKGGGGWRTGGKYQLDVPLQELVMDMLKQLIAPFGTSNPFSCLPAALTEGLGRPGRPPADCGCASRHM